MSMIVVVIVVALGAAALYDRQRRLHGRAGWTGPPSHYGARDFDSDGRMED